jgi:hypothetical protein
MKAGLMVMVKVLIKDGEILKIEDGCKKIDCW